MHSHFEYLFPKKNVVDINDRTMIMMWVMMLLMMINTTFTIIVICEFGECHIVVDHGLQKFRELGKIEIPHY